MEHFSLIPALLVVSLLLFGCLGGPLAPPSDNGVQAPEPNNGTVPTESQAICANDNSVLERDCMTGIAKAKGTGDACEEIESEDRYDRAYCYSQVAMEKGDAGLCGKIDDEFYKSQCFYEYAATLEDAEACGRITAEIDRGNCYATMAILKEDKGYCENTEGGRCLITIAILKEDESVCDEIEEEGWKKMCESTLLRKEKKLLCESNYPYATQKIREKYC